MLMDNKPEQVDDVKREYAGHTPPHAMAIALTEQLERV